MDLTKQENSPELWQGLLPRPRVDGHKYHRGHAAIFAAPELTGATRLAAVACSRVGAGLVTVVAPDNADIYRTTLPEDIMIRETVSDKVTVAVAGSGGISKSNFDQLLKSRPNIREWVLDADLLNAEHLQKFPKQKTILTPHVGEFERMFGPIEKTAAEAVVRASRETETIIVLKSSRTLVADWNGRLVVNNHTSPYLAKAGTGDVLAGMITGLVAQGMPFFEAASAAVWMHGEAGLRIGPGLIAGDIPETIPGILTDLL